MAGYHHRALPPLQEAIALYKSQPLPPNPRWVAVATGAIRYLADIMEQCGRVEEAAAALEEAIEVRRVARFARAGLNPQLILAQVYMEMGQFERALKWGREAERVVELWCTGPNPGPDLRTLVVVTLSTVHATLASAYESLG